MPQSCNIFSVLSIFKYHPGKQIINSSLFRIILTSSRRKRRVIVYGLVTRYGPRISCQRKGLNSVCFSRVFETVEGFSGRRTKIQQSAAVVAFLRSEASFCLGHENNSQSEEHAATDLCVYIDPSCICCFRPPFRASLATGLLANKRSGNSRRPETRELADTIALVIVPFDRRRSYFVFFSRVCSSYVYVNRFRLK